MSLSIGINLSSFITTDTSPPPPPPGPPPVITSTSFDDSSDAWIIETDTPGSGSYHWARVALGSAAPTPNGFGGWSGTVLETGSVAVGPSGASLSIEETGDTNIQYDLYVYQRAAGRDSNVISITYTANNTPPVLSAATGISSNMQGTLQVTTDDATGVLYWVCTGSPVVPSFAQILAGLDHTGTLAADAGFVGVTTTGEHSDAATGLTNGATYYFHVVHEDSHGNQSTAVSSAGFVPAAPAASLGEIGTATELLNVTSISSPQTTSAYTVPAGSNRAFCIALSLYNGGTAITDIAVTFGAQPMTLLGSLYKSFGGSVALFYLKEPDIPSGAQSATITVTGGAPNSAIASTMTFEGVNQTTSFGAPVTGTGGNAQISGTATVTTSNAGSHVISALAARKDSDAFLPVTADTMTLKVSAEAHDGSGSDGIGHATGLGIPGSPASHDQTFTWANGGSWSMIAAEVLEN